MGGVGGGEQVVLTAIRSRAFHFHMVSFTLLASYSWGVITSVCHWEKGYEEFRLLSVFERTAMEEMGWLGCIGVGFYGLGGGGGRRTREIPKPGLSGLEIMQGTAAAWWQRRGKQGVHMRGSIAYRTHPFSSAMVELMGVAVVP